MAEATAPQTGWILRHRSWEYVGLAAPGVTLTVTAHARGTVTVTRRVSDPAYPGMGRRWDGGAEAHRGAGIDVADLAAWAVLHDDPTYLVDHLAEEYGGVWGEAALAIAASRGA